jgi:hypothetical protein
MSDIRLDFCIVPGSCFIDYLLEAKSLTADNSPFEARLLGARYVAANISQILPTLELQETTQPLVYVRIRQDL